MDPIKPITQHTLRFSGVQPQVLAQLQAERLTQDSQVLFGEKLDVFVKQDSQLGGTVELVTQQANANRDSKAIPYGSGLFRHLHRMLTGKDIQPSAEIKTPIEQSGDMFIRTTESQN